MTEEANKLEQEEIDVKALIGKIMSKWYYFAISSVIVAMGVLFYLRYSIPIYRTEATLIVNNGDNKSAMNLFSLDQFSSANNDEILTEIEVLQSVSLTKQVLDTLAFEVSVFVKGSIKTSEVYDKKPFSIKNLVVTSSRVEDIPININFKSNQVFEVSYEASVSEDSNSPDDLKGSMVVTECQVGGECDIEYAKFKLELNPKYAQALLETKYFVVFNSLEKLLMRYRSTQISETKLGSRVLRVSIKDPVPGKAIDFVNTLCSIYISNGLKEKNQAHENSIVFIDKQMVYIQDSIDQATQKLLTFSNLKMANFENDLSTEQLNGVIRDLEIKERTLSRQNNNFKKALEEIEGGKTASVLLLAEKELEVLFTELSELRTKKLELASVVTSENPTYEVLEEQINNVEKRIETILTESLQANESLVLDLRNDKRAFEGTVSGLYVAEKEYLMAKRKYDIANEYYTFLLEKKTESEITKAASVPNDKVLDEAQEVLTEQVSPRKNILFLLGIVLAFGVPLVLIIVTDYFDNKISHVGQIEARTTIPVLGSIIFNKKETNIVESPKSAFAESFRALRLNVEFLSPDKEGAKVIGFTSTISGEGKTYCAANLGIMQAMSGKKTLIIGADLRKPKLMLHFNGEQSSSMIGLTDYLVAGTYQVEDIINHTHVENLDVIHSGSIPPNPMELLESEKMKSFINSMKERYDYVIVDNAPLGLVPDYFVLQKYLDYSIFVTKHRYSYLTFINDLDKKYKSGSLSNVAILLNAVDPTKGGYGSYGSYGSYGYGYYSDDHTENKGWLSKIFSKKS